MLDANEIIKYAAIVFAAYFPSPTCMVIYLSYKSQRTDSLQTTNILFLKRINYIHKKGLNLCNIFTEFEVKCLIHAH